ncbi:hypothetical protein [Actinomadura atramentaria]|uniref:hypothetical protein n=1 Tax=Actinomadura atramentaria TaxID=1990 RepID=UPI0003725290|nr:hypothetical protein [Actinomadura atramentaria]
MIRLARRAAALVLPAALAVSGLAAASLAATTVAAPAALADTPAPGVPDLDLSDCPDSLPVGAKPDEWFCEVLITNAGHMKVGAIDQPITQPLIITSIAGVDPKTGKDVTRFIRMRSKPMTVAGGALGIPGTDSLPLLGLSVEPQYAGTFEMDIPNFKATLSLKLKLNNELLGNSCYVGTDEKPIKLDLDLSGIQMAPGSSLVQVQSTDKTFAAPATSGCGLLTPIADWRGGLPSPSGGNAAELTSYLGGVSYADM